MLVMYVVVSSVIYVCSSYFIIRDNLESDDVISAALNSIVPAFVTAALWPLVAFALLMSWLIEKYVEKSP